MKINIGFKRIEDRKRYDRIWRKKYNKLTKNVKSRLAGYRYRDKKDNHTICDLTYEELKYLLENNICIYCGGNNNLGLDRINNNKGHTKDNVVVSCLFCNTLRGNKFTHEEMLEVGKAIKKIMLHRNFVDQKKR